MAHGYFSNQDVHVEALFRDTNNVCICSRAHLKDYYYRPDDYGLNFEENGHEVLQDPSEDPEMPYENAFEEDFELMKSMGLPTSFGKVFKGYNKVEDSDYMDNDYEDNELDGDEYAYDDSRDLYEYDDDHNYEEFDNDNNLVDVNNKNLNCSKRSPKNSETNERISTSHSEINADFANYWDLHGETILLNSWIQKYKDYINPDYDVKLIKSFKNASTDESNCDSALKSVNDKFQSMSFSDKKEADFVNDGKMGFLINKETDENAILEDIEIKFQNDEAFSYNTFPNLGDSFVKNQFQNDQLEKAIVDIDSHSVLSNLYGSEEKSIDCEDNFENKSGIFNISDAFSKFDRELDSLKEMKPDAFVQKHPNNMFSCTVPVNTDGEKSVNVSELTEQSWAELWDIHCQEQYQYHLNLFSESIKNAGKDMLVSLKEENETSKAFKCNLCGDCNCDFCGSDYYGSGNKVYTNDANGELFNTFVSNSCIKEDAKSYWTDHKTVLAYPVINDSIAKEDPSLPDNIFALENEGDEAIDIIHSGEVSAEILQETKEDDDDSDPPTELPIKRMHEAESDSEEAADLIKELGLVIRPTNALKIKRNKRRRIRKSYSKCNKLYSRDKDFKGEDRNSQENEEATIENSEANNLTILPPMECEELSAAKSSECNETVESFLDLIQNDPVIHKYWYQRYRLFYRFDEGIKLDKESWFSVTPERIAQHTAERCACDVIIDAFCGAGGNAIQFAFTCSHVIAIDIDPKKIELAKHNAAIYGVDDKIDFIVGDYLALASSLKADGVFLSPPWGGPQYCKDAEYDIAKIEPNIYETFEVSRRISPNIALFVPKNTIVNQLVKLSGDGNSVEVEQNFLNKKVKTLTAYYGDFVNQPDDDVDKKECDS